MERVGHRQAVRIPEDCVPFASGNRSGDQDLLLFDWRLSLAALSREAESRGKCTTLSEAKAMASAVLIRWSNEMRMEDGGWRRMGEREVEVRISRCGECHNFPAWRFRPKFVGSDFAKSCNLYPN